jgi:CheY-like chemotaxis protein
MGNTILLADKSITIQKIVELTFADEDYVIRCINDGNTALEMIPQIRPDIILADIGLPGVSGYDLCSTLRTDPAYAAFSNTPMILLAGIYETMDEERAKYVEDRVRTVGANDYLSKPFDSQVLVEKVKAYIGGSGSNSAGDTVAATVPTPGIDFFTESPVIPEPKTEPVSVKEDIYPPPDDTEKTMIIEGPPGFSPSIFAEKSPVEQSAEEDMVGSSTVKISASELEEARAAYARISQPESSSSPLSDETPAFGVEATMSMKIDTADIATSTQVFPGSDEPFGNVFEESTARWRLSPLGEEENPFGLPEQELPAPPPPTPAVEEVLAESNSASEAIMSFQVERIESEFDTASFARETGIEPPASPDVEPLDEASSVPKVQPSDVPPESSADTPERASLLEDTLPEDHRITAAEEFSIVENTVPEGSLINESIPGNVEEFDSKQNLIDIADAPTEPVVVPEVPREAQSSGSVEIPNELIDRIVEKVIARLSDRVVSEIVWQVVPDLAEKMIRRELEKIQAGEE